MSYRELRRIPWSDMPRLKRDLIVIGSAETTRKTYVSPLT